MAHIKNGKVVDKTKTLQEVAEEENNEQTQLLAAQVQLEKEVKAYFIEHQLDEETPPDLSKMKKRKVFKSLTQETLNQVWSRYKTKEQTKGSNT